MTQIRTKRGNTHASGVYTMQKHYSKLHIGYLKMRLDQEAKPEIVAINTGLETYDDTEGKYVPLMRNHNNKSSSKRLNELIMRSRTSSLLGIARIVPQPPKYALASSRKKRLEYLRLANRKVN